MSERISPLAIKIMLACYYSPQPESEFTGYTWDSSAAVAARNYLIQEGLIDEAYKALPRGEAWANFICSTPLPVNKWVMPERETVR